MHADMPFNARMYEGAAQTQPGLTVRVSNIVAAQRDVEVGDKNGYAKISCISIQLLSYVSFGTGSRNSRPGQGRDGSR